MGLARVQWVVTMMGMPVAESARCRYEPHCFECRLLPLVWTSCRYLRSWKASQTRALHRTCVPTHGCGYYPRQQRPTYLSCTMTVRPSSSSSSVVSWPTCSASRRRLCTARSRQTCVLNVAASSVIEHTFNGGVRQSHVAMVQDAVHVCLGTMS